MFETKPRENQNLEVEIFELARKRSNDYWILSIKIHLKVAQKGLKSLKKSRWIVWTDPAGPRGTDGRTKKNLEKPYVTLLIFFIFSSFLNPLMLLLRFCLLATFSELPSFGALLDRPRSCSNTDFTSWILKPVIAVLFCSFVCLFWGPFLTKKTNEKQIKNKKNLENLYFPRIFLVCPTQKPSQILVLLSFS